MQEVRIIAKSPRIDISVPMGDGPAVITGGLGGWQSVERIDDIAFTTWEGQEPLTQDVPLLLDGNGRTPRSVQAELNTLLQLGRDFDHTERDAPPIFKVWGPVFFEGKSWVLGDGGIELGTSDTWRLEDGTLIRQSLVLHLLEYVKPQTIRRKRPKIGLGPGEVVPGGGSAHLYGNEVVGGTYTVKAGDTLAKIAAKLYGSWEAWEPIGVKNALTDPNRKLPVGKRLLLP